MIFWSACQVKYMLPSYNFTLVTRNRPISSHDSSVLRRRRSREHNITNIEKESGVTQSRDFY